ncbi:hypothetical protein ZIOFF_006470 [Zingiber officinale]|uniref:Uncharacterized protein n=1 Tax=Zingiber officinale TaxID=94328 RepID=A0A8J5ICP0_ZINOF|nr:hypothetical protein ZIOFF_006470 [Zingiber officinale]
MAIASLFADLLRQARPRNPSITILRAFPLSLRQPSRPLSSGLSNSQGLAVEEESAALVDDLRSQIFRLRFPKRSSIDALDRWVREGRTVTTSEHREITKDLRKLKRFKHTLELSLLSPLLLNHLYQIGLESNINAIPLDVMVFQFQLVGFQKDAGKDVAIGFQIDGSSAYGTDNENEDVPALQSARMTLEDQMTHLEEMVRREIQGIHQDMGTYQQRKIEMYEMIQCWDLAYQAPPPPPSDDALEYWLIRRISKLCTARKDRGAGKDLQQCCSINSRWWSEWLGSKCRLGHSGTNSGTRVPESGWPALLEWLASG